VLIEEEVKAERIKEQARDRILEERRLQLEGRRLEMEERRWRSEMETKEKDREMKEKERELREKELELKRVVAENEEKHKESPAYQLKLWGDALHNTIGRMPNESVEIMSWFISLDWLYVQLGVPNDLQAILLRPHLNGRAKNLLTRFDASRSDQSIKKYLLQEMQLTPKVYLDKFNSVVKESSETFHQFGNRLSSLFEYYVESRQINRDYDKLMQLLIYDRIKSALPQFLAKHVLALEAVLSEKGGWLGKQGLIDALDAYMAGVNPSNSKPTTSSKPMVPSSSNRQVYKSPQMTEKSYTVTGNQGQMVPTSIPRNAFVGRCYL